MGPADDDAFDHEAHTDQGRLLQNCCIAVSLQVETLASCHEKATQILREFYSRPDPYLTFSTLKQQARAVVSSAYALHLRGKHLEARLATAWSKREETSTAAIMALMVDAVRQRTDVGDNIRELQQNLTRLINGKAIAYSNMGLWKLPGSGGRALVIRKR